MLLWGISSLNLVGRFRGNAVVLVTRRCSPFPFDFAITIPSQPGMRGWGTYSSIKTLRFSILLDCIIFLCFWTGFVSWFLLFVEILAVFPTMTFSLKPQVTNVVLLCLLLLCRVFIRRWRF